MRQLLAPRRKLCLRNLIEAWLSNVDAVALKRRGQILCGEHHPRLPGAHAASNLCRTDTDESAHVGQRQASTRRSFVVEYKPTFPTLSLSFRGAFCIRSSYFRFASIATSAMNFCAARATICFLWSHRRRQSTSAACRRQGGASHSRVRALKPRSTEVVIHRLIRYLITIHTHSSNTATRDDRAIILRQRNGKPWE